MENVFHIMLENLILFGLSFVCIPKIWGSICYIQMTTDQGKFNITRSIICTVCSLALTCLSPRFAASIMLTKLPAIMMTARLFGPFHPGGEISFYLKSGIFLKLCNVIVGRPAFHDRSSIDEVPLHAEVACSGGCQAALKFSDIWFCTETQDFGSFDNISGFFASVMLG